MFITLSSCDVNEPKKDKPKPEGYQEDIPWPSLADSPWPMCFHDPQATGRTKYKGPSYGIVEWVLDSLNGYENAPVIGKDGTIYTCVPTIYNSENQRYRGLLAIDSKGFIKWNYDLGFSAELIPIPVLSVDNTIYVFGGFGPIDTLFAISTSGKLKWKKKLPTTGNHHIVQTSIVLGKTGNLFFADVLGNIYCFDKDGNQNWIKKTNYVPSNQSQFSFSPDGKTFYYSNSLVSLVATAAENGELLWTYGNRGTNITPIIDSKGNIYTIIKTKNSWEQELVCLDKNKNLKWSYSFYEHNFESSFTQPCIDKLGNIFFGRDTLFSVNYKGELRWKYSENGFQISTPIICDGNGNVFFGKNNSNNSIFYSFDTEGTLRWKCELNYTLGACPSLSYNNRLLIPTSLGSNSLLLIK